MKLYKVLSVFLLISFFGFSQEISFSKSALEDIFIAADGEKTTFESIIENNKGHIVLVDIWASWCKDCIVGIPTIKKLTADYPEISFVYISLDKNEKKWKKAMKKYDFNSRQHFWAPKGWESDFFTAIDLDWIPRYMVIDEKGKIKLFKAVKASDENIVEQFN